MKRQRPKRKEHILDRLTLADTNGETRTVLDARAPHPFMGIFSKDGSSVQLEIDRGSPRIIMRRPGGKDALIVVVPGGAGHPTLSLYDEGPTWTLHIGDFLQPGTTRVCVFKKGKLLWSGPLKKHQSKNGKKRSDGKR